MAEWKIHTPDGVQDLLFDECHIKRGIENKIRNVFVGRGFFEIETPTIEFFDVFSGDDELVRQESMFKFFDASGRILVLRPDFTVPVARVKANKLRDVALPLRVSYLGNTFRYDQMGGGKQKEFTQAGVELIGVSGPEVDAEVLATAITALKATGLESFQLDVGQVEFFKGIMEETGLNADEVEKVRQYIDSKDFLGLEEVVRSHGFEGAQKELILSLPGLFGSTDVIDRAYTMTSNPRALSALDNLRKVLGILKDYNLDKYISIDLGMVQSLNYYTGIIFKGFTYGVGFPVLGGGRYDSLVERYGEAAPATGFAIGVNLLMMALERQKIESSVPRVDSIVTYCDESRATAFVLAEELRRQGLVVELDICRLGLDGLKDYCRTKGIGGILSVAEAERIDVFNVGTGEMVRTSVSELVGREK